MFSAVMRSKVHSKPHYIQNIVRQFSCSNALHPELYDAKLYIRMKIKHLALSCFLENYFLVIRTKCVKFVKHDRYICVGKDYRNVYL